VTLSLVVFGGIFLAVGATAFGNILLIAWLVDHRKRVCAESRNTHVSKPILAAFGAGIRSLSSLRLGRPTPLDVLLWNGRA
jgi:hypothetical protein